MQYSNMGPFDPTKFKGSALVQAVPMFVDKLPLMVGGLAGANANFGRVVSVDPSAPRNFRVGWASGQIARGILVADPSIMMADPAMNDKYYEGRPAVIAVFGPIELMKYDLTQNAPTLGSKVWFNNTTGEIAFTESGVATLSGYTQLNASVLDVDVPNTVSIWLRYPVVAATSTALVDVADPAVTNTPAASGGDGSSGTPYLVSAGTVVKATSTTPGAVIYYTLDGSDPTMASPIMPSTGIALSAGSVTLKLVAAKAGMDPSAVVTVYYTVS